MPVRRIIFSVYVLMGMLAGVATVLLCARLGSASPVSGNLYELDAIGAVVIGGTSLAGGRASIVGTFLGVITFALIFSLMTQMNLSTEVQQVTKGADRPRRRPAPEAGGPLLMGDKPQQEVCHVAEATLHLRPPRLRCWRWVSLPAAATQRRLPCRRRPAATRARPAAPSSGEKVKIIASVPPTDHGWLGAISKNAKSAGREVRRRRLRAAPGGGRRLAGPAGGAGDRAEAGRARGASAGRRGAHACGSEGREGRASRS